MYISIFLTLPEASLKLSMFYFYMEGCKGNENRFATVDECVNTCGGNEPETQSLCSEVVCDRGEAMFFKAKGCLPITKKGKVI